jgi:hypothetical protein
MPQEVTYITLHAPVVKFRTTKHTQSLRIAVGMCGWPSARVCGRHSVFAFLGLELVCIQGNGDIGSLLWLKLVWPLLMRNHY